MPGRRFSLSARLGASLTGNVPADEVQERLAAAAVAYELYLSAEQLRSELAAAGITPATASPAESSQLLCTWNAYALVSLAQAFVDAEGLESGKPGFLPRVTAQQALTLLSEVALWVARARRAATDPGFDVAAEVALPSPLPPWVIVEPCPRSHALAMQAAGRAMLDRVEAELASLEQMPAASAETLRLRGMATQTHSQLQSAAAVLSAARGAQAHEGIEQPLRAAVSECYALGQLLARPLLMRRLPQGQLSALPPLPGPPQGYPPPMFPNPPRGYDRGYGHHGYGHHGDHGDH